MDEAKKLDDWRMAQSVVVAEKTGTSVLNCYRALVRDDIRPNPVNVFPLAVQETEKQIRHEMDSLGGDQFFERLPHILSRLYEFGLRDGREEINPSSVAEALASDERFAKLRDELRTEEVSPVRRHLQAVRDRENQTFRAEPGYRSSARDWREV